jgi:hypothetical protein
MNPADPELVTYTALAMAIAFTMIFSSVKKNALELRRRRRICPSCGRNIAGAVCREH